MRNMFCSSEVSPKVVRRESARTPAFDLSKKLVSGVRLGSKKYLRSFAQLLREKPVILWGECRGRISVSPTLIAARTPYHLIHLLARMNVVVCESNDLPLQTQPLSLIQARITK